MKPLSAALLCFALLGCASDNKARSLEPEVQFVQITGPAEEMYPDGAFDVQYGLRIRNRSADTITLSRVQIETVGSGGPYRVPREIYYVKRALNGGEIGDVAFWAHAVATGSRFSIDAQAPVTVRGIAHFDSAAGPLRKIFIVNLGQTDGGRR